MLRPRWRKVLADLVGNAVRTTLVVASIAVGLFAIGIIATIYAVARVDMTAGYSMIHPANFLYSTTSFDDQLVDRIKRVPGVADVQGVRAFSVRVRNKDNEWVPINITAVEANQALRINQLSLRSGTLYPKEKEIILDEYKLNSELKQKLDEKIEIKLPSGKIRWVKLAGVVNDQSIGASGGAGGFFLAPPQGYISTDTLEWFEQPYAWNQLWITSRTGHEDIDYLRGLGVTLTKEVEENGQEIFNTTIRKSTEHPNSVYTEAVAAVMFVLGALVVFLSGFLITNTLQALIAQQINQVGIMKIVGARRHQIIRLYIALIFVFSVIAFVISVPLSYFASIALLRFLSSQMNFSLLPHGLIPSAVLLQAGLALIVPQFAALFPIFHGTRVTVQEAISGIVNNPLSRPGVLERNLHRVRRLSRPMIISIRNIFRRKGRLALTLTTLALGGSIFCATFIVRLSLQEYIARASRYFLADVNLTLDRPYRIEVIEQILHENPHVSQVEGWAVARGEILMSDDTVADSVSIMAPPATTKLVDPILLKGRWIISGDENAITLSERFVELFPDLEPGGRIRLKINGEESDWTVVGFFQLAGKSAGYMAYMDYDELASILKTRKSAFVYRVVADKPSLTLAEQKEFALSIESLLQGKGYKVVESSAGMSLSESSTDGLNVLTIFLMIMALLTALVGSIGLMGTMSMNVLERTREIGIMRAIGATDSIIFKLVVVEGVLIGLQSWLLSGIISIPVSKVMANQVNMAIFNSTAGYTYTSNGLWIWLGLVLILSILASVLPARLASRLTIREVLAYE